jgi:hypothetical protein
MSLISKWNLTQVPDTILQEPIIPDDIPCKLEYYERFLDRPPFGYPVEAILPPNGIPARCLNLKVDLTEPLDLLLHLIVECLREYRPKQESRRRSNKADYQLAVYDLQQLGLEFDMIAEKLGKRSRTVKGRTNSVRSAWLSAYKKIHGQRAVTGMQEEVNLHDCEACAVCRIAQRPEDLCALARRYADFDEQSQHDVVGRMAQGENILDKQNVVTAKWGGNRYVRSSQN